MNFVLCIRLGIEYTTECVNSSLEKLQLCVHRSVSALVPSPERRHFREQTLSLSSCHHLNYVIGSDCDFALTIPERQSADRRHISSK